MFFDVFEPHDERAKDSANAQRQADFFHIQFKIKVIVIITGLVGKVIYFESNLKVNDERII